MPRYKSPPHNLDAERSVIGSVFIDNACLQQTDLSPADFYPTAHQIIWKAILEVSASHCPIDFITITNHLKKSNSLEAAGNVPGIAEIIDSVPTAANVSVYVKIVKDKAARRKFIEQMRGLAVRAYDDDPMEDIIDEAQVTFRYILEELSGKKQTLSDEVREWVLSSHGVIVSSDFGKFRHLSSLNEKKNVSKVFERMVEEGVIERTGNKNGHFRKIDGECDIIKWWESSGDFVPIKFPLDIHDYCHLYPKNIAVIAGAPNAGKSAFLLDFCRLNMKDHKIRYLSSEMVDNELKKRIEKFCIEHDMRFEDWKKIDFRERALNFADVIDPDNITVIDYLECNVDFYMMGQWIKDIFDKLKKGICLIAIQKKPGDENRLGRGGLGTLEKPRLYLSMDNGKIRIEKGKNWAIEGVNPNGLEKKFALVQGSKFINMGTWEEGK